jgi:hypothetical protein
MIITLDTNTMKEIREHAIKHAKSSYECYVRRGQTNKKKIAFDCFIGKLAEQAVCNKFNTTQPDYKIYEIFNKSFSADLMKNGKSIHVKTQYVDQSKRYGLSWMFSKYDVECNMPYKLNDIILMTQVNKDMSVDLYGWVYIKEVIDLFAPPQVQRLIASKEVLYAKTIRNIIRYFKE